ncbi:MAG: DUF2780 domain-containing protein [Methyloligellaceae bacterium]
MKELIDRLVANIGIDATTAENVLGIVFNLFKDKLSGDELQSLISVVPGVSELMEKAGSSENSSGLGGMLSGAIGALTGNEDLMSTLSKLQSQGLSIDQAQGAGKEILNFAKEKIGEDAVKNIANSIPGLSQLL